MDLMNYIKYAMVEFENIRKFAIDKYLSKHKDKTVEQLTEFTWLLDFIDRYEKLRETFVMEGNEAIEIVGESSLELLLELPDNEQQEVYDVCKNLCSYYSAKELIKCDEAVDGGVLNGIHLVIIDGGTWTIQAFYKDEELIAGTFTSGDMLDILIEYSEWARKYES